MLRQNSNSCFSKDHGLEFSIEGAVISVDEMGVWVANLIRLFPSEAIQEQFAHDVTHEIYKGVARKVDMAKALAERARVRKLWIELHPPNFAGYYYCHIGGEWVHISCAQLEHITPLSVEKVDTDVLGWDEKLRMACSPHNMWKGSRQDVPSATLEYAPPDEEC